MKKIYFFLAALLCCIVNVQLQATETVLYESNGIHYVLVTSTFGSVTSLSAYVVHPETSIEVEDSIPTTPSSYTGSIVIEDTIHYAGGDFPVKFIDNNAFLQSTITSIDLPATTTVFSPGAFMDCLALQTIICRAQTPPSTRIHSIPWDYADIFGSLDPDQVSVYVPKGTMLMYQETGGWDSFSDYFTIDSMQAIEQTPFLSGEGRGEASKLLKDGRLLILRGDKLYTPTGAEIQ